MRVGVAVAALAAAAGLALYASGFFLTRTELPHVSACRDVCGSGDGGGGGGGGGGGDGDGSVEGDACWAVGWRGREGEAADGRRRPRFARLLLLVVDAWRLDFVDPGAPPSLATGHMPRLAARLRGDDPAARASDIGLFPFVADPPTVTMQRLKALLTGSLPTFLDVAADLSSSALQEDNLLAQAARRGRGQERIFLGDDTWMALAPRGAFTRAVPFESLNVRDLHTVDAGVAAALLPSVSDPAANWSMLVGHFLGVDHVGHTFNSPHVPAMAAKLQELDGVLDAALDAVPSDTLVAILGDHGMTAGGAHGGASADETGAALLLYAPRSGLLAPRPAGSATVRRGVAQLDLVPTLALLLGLPIPFASLGHVIPDVLLAPEHPASSACQAVHAAAAAAVNARQMARYIDAYGASGRGARPLAGDGESVRATAALDAALTAWREHVAATVAGASITPPRMAGGCVCSAIPEGRRSMRGDGTAARFDPPVRCAEMALADAVCMSGGGGFVGDDAALARAAYASRDALLAAMDDVAAMFRRMWVEFDDATMAWGLALAAAGVLVLVVTALVGVARSLPGAPRTRDAPSHRDGAAVAAAAAVGLCAQLILQPAPTLGALRTACAFAAAVGGGGGGVRLPETPPAAPAVSAALPPPTGTLLEWIAPPALGGAAAAWRLPFLLPPAVGLPVGALLAWLAVTLAAAAASCRRSSSRTVPAAGATGVPVSPIALAAAVLLVRRVDTAFSSSFIVSEARVAAFFAAAAMVLLGASAARAHFRAASSGGGTSGWVIAATLAAGVAAIRVTTPGTGGAWPFPGGTTWSLHAPAALTPATGAAFIAAPVAVALVAGGTPAARAAAGVHACLNAAVAAYWHATRDGGAAAATATAVRLWLPRGVFAVAAVTSAGASFWLPQPARSLAPARAVAEHPVFAAARLALPALHLLMGPASMLVLPAALVAVWAVAVLQRHSSGPAGGGSGKCSSAQAATALLRSESWLPTAAGAWVADHFFCATGHGSQFSALAVTAAYVGWDTFAPLRAAAAVAINTLGVHALVACVLAGLTPAGAAGGRAGTATLIAVPHALVALAAAVMSCVARRHLMVWALFAPRFVFAAATAGVSLGCAVAASCCCCGRRGAGLHAHPE